jgi:hypothetical protein
MVIHVIFLVFEQILIKSSQHESDSIKSTQIEIDQIKCFEPSYVLMNYLW